MLPFPKDKAEKHKVLWGAKPGKQQLWKGPWGQRARAGAGADCGGPRSNTV